MNLKPSAHEVISELRTFFQSTTSRHVNQDEEPLKAELYSSDQMERFGDLLATIHKVSRQKSKEHLLKRLADNEILLNEVRNLLTESIKNKVQITPAGEWLIDNFYLIEEHIRIAKIHFPKGYSEDLPQLSNVSSKGVTRIYDIVQSVISHSDGRIDIDNLSRFINAYQKVVKLKLGELWAIPIMLRLALIENLRRVAARVAVDRVNGKLGDYWATQMIETVEKNPAKLILVIADMARSNPPIVGAFVAELIRQLRGKGPDLAMALNWIEQQLAESGLTSTEVVDAEIQKQASNQVSMSNSISSLRLLNTTDWRRFVEKHSIVEQILKEDNDAIYGSMDFSTRDIYRHVVEHISKKSKLEEHEVAQLAIQLSNESAKLITPDNRSSHVGYYLIGPGVAQTRTIAKMRIPLSKKVLGFLQKHRLFSYLTFFLLITIFLTSWIMLRAVKDTNSYWLLSIIAILTLICVSQFAVSLVNFFSTLLIKPHFLPRMDFSKQIPPESRTMVVVPAMLSSIEAIENLVEWLEVRYLSNRDNNLHFGLLTDLNDASEETLPGDQVLIDLAKGKIEALNRKYKTEKNNLFYLFVRPRFWNPKENVWMGYERKRGKISELNSLLRGDKQNRFSLIIGDQSILSSIKFVITLDADTQLPMGTAWKLIGTMAHPLNHAWFDEKKKRITKGYGIIQPRVTVSLPEISGSLYARMNGNEPGIDPYTRASSDVYQDLFKEGSFIGKGIYEVDTFKKVLDAEFAENKILSHDLLEGCYVRSGLLSDVQLFEKYPDRYQIDMKRRSRWVRGDWQIISWVFPYNKGSQNRLHKNLLSGLSKWKIFDNIRRSLVPIALTLLILLGWLVLPSPFYWTMIVSAIIVVPDIITSMWDLIRKPKDVIVSHHLRNSINNTIDISIKTLFKLITIPYEAYVNFVAISRTLWRMLITKKHLLEWNPSANERNEKKDSLISTYLVMWINVVLPIGLFIYLYLQAPQKLSIVSPIAFIWLLAPFITRWVSKPQAPQVSELTHHQNIFLRKIARKTWGFFERFINENDNWLPPDNFQEQPVLALAHRTSPTNIGLSLLANITAHGFGYITTAQLIERTSNTLGTMKKMERYKGHYYNWYDTETLTPLFPKYISTVDSGNLVGHLFVLRQGLLAIPNQKIVSPNLIEGLRDTLHVITDILKAEDVQLLQSFEKQLDAAAKFDPQLPHDVKISIESLSKSSVALLEKLHSYSGSEMNWWEQRLKIQLEQLNESFQIFTPWVLLKTAPSKFSDLGSFDKISTLMDLLETSRKLIDEVNQKNSLNNNTDENKWLDSFLIALTASVEQAEIQINAAETLAKQCIGLTIVFWDFLYDKNTKLFSIGYNVHEHQLDLSYYDLLASEVRLGVFIAIAQGKLPEESWFALGRLLTKIDKDPILLSWSGSMFEYLMPLLVMPTYENTLLDQTCKAAVKWQIKYGKKSGLPWGISESGYNMINADSHYQYRAFGAPGLGLKRGLEEDFVIAPYATALSLMVAPEKACKNLEVLHEKGMEGQYGFYEAIDYTSSRLPRGQSSAIVYSYMAHHQGMCLLSLAYLLLDKPIQKLFEAEPQFKATLLLLQERIPKATTFFTHTTDISEINYLSSAVETRIITTPNTPIPEVQLLSNGKYHVMLTNAGGGNSRWNDLAVTRWREDATRDNWGTFCFIRDLDNNVFWSNTRQPSQKKGEKFEVAFSHGHVAYRTSNSGIDTNTDVVVSPEDDIELRRVHISNHSDEKRTIEVTSYAEVVLAPAASDLMQPTFSNLFVQTEINAAQHAICCSRRPRSADEKSPWMFHLMTLHGKNADQISFETDRMEFVGRGNDISNPQVMNSAGPLKGNAGAVLDPIVSIRYKITLQPEESVTLDLILGATEDKETCQRLIEKYQDKHHRDRVFELAWTHSQVILRQINASEGDVQLYERLASSVIFANEVFRADPSILINNRKGQSGLWAYSISGDLPIVLLRVEKQVNIQLVSHIIKAHAYWRLKGLKVDLVIWNEEHNIYRQDFHEGILDLIPTELKDKPGGIFVRSSDQISSEDRILFQSVARINISDNGGTLVEQINRKAPAKFIIPLLIPEKKFRPDLKQLVAPANLVFDNGLGGFSPDGSEYVIVTDAKKKTPVPWVNVIANPNFGTVVSESGSSYTWVENAHEIRLTPWNNDPVTDAAGEAYYIRDYETGHFWSTTLLPSGGKSSYITRHGFGYTTIEHLEDGIYSEMKVYVDLEAAVKFTVIKIRNQSDRTRKLSATGYVEWVLGDNRVKTGMHIRTEMDPDTGAIFALNHYNPEFTNRIAFFDADYLKKSFTSDRTEFIGRNGSLKNPDGMLRQKLSGKTGLALDPCAAIQVPFDLAEGEEREIIFRLGAGKDAQHVIDTVQKFRGNETAKASFEKVKKYWQETVSALQIETPDSAINMIANGWLTYQTLSSRLWGRSGFYQSGGAFGFRDQLQDVLSLLHPAPQLAREQILLSASRQFIEGDVQHWWHPPFGNGVRTRCSDDFLWLPLVAAIYISHTGDKSILDESVHFLEGRPLNNDEESYYDLPVISIASAKLYEHCVRAIKNGFRFGEHGLPLIGTGDWNDGYDKVGFEGKGESVWMAFFLYEVLQRFSVIAKLNNDSAFEAECEKQSMLLKENIDKHAWDGEWYKRAWFDDGTPLGSSVNEECKIDSIAQSWSVLSGAGAPERSKEAMESAYNNLVKKDIGIIQLLIPPFDKSDLNAGYIKGYLPGVRENGGQYTHAAVWLIMAFAKLGDNQRVWELLNLINPVNHGKTSEKIAIYKVEPYVLAADVYASKSHAGRGGWTWYTGSASWFYRLITENFLGLQKEGNILKIIPCIPKEWQSFTLHYRYKKSIYHIVVNQDMNIQNKSVEVDGVMQENNEITLMDDSSEYNVKVLLPIVESISSK